MMRPDWDKQQKEWFSRICHEAEIRTLFGNCLDEKTIEKMIDKAVDSGRESFGEMLIRKGHYKYVHMDGRDG